MHYESNYLAHYGVVGMKWGVRRYQNKDGSLTAKGKRHRKQQYAAEARKMSDDDLRKSVDRLNLEKQYKDMLSSPGGRTKRLEEASKRAEKSSKIAQNISGENSKEHKLAKGTQSFLKTSAEASKSFDKTKSVKKARNIDVSHMTDAELRSHINRMQMETRYTDLKYEDATRGQKSVGRVLENTANAILVGASAVELAKKVYPFIQKPAATVAVTGTIKKATKAMAKAAL